MASWEEMWHKLRAERPRYASVRAMAEDIGVSDESLGRWLEAERPTRVSRENQRAVADWHQRLVPQHATQARMTREPAAAYTAAPHGASMAAGAGWNDGVRHSVAVMMRTLAGLIEETSHADERVQALAGILEATQPSAQQPPQASAPQSRRRAKG